MRIFFIKPYWYKQFHQCFLWVFKVFLHLFTVLSTYNLISCFLKLFLLILKMWKTPTVLKANIPRWYLYMVHLDLRITLFLGAWGKMNHEKTWSKKSRDTVPLRCFWCWESACIRAVPAFKILFGLPVKHGRGPRG